jgi:hypothetical protein
MNHHVKECCSAYFQSILVMADQGDTGQVTPQSPACSGTSGNLSTYQAAMCRMWPVAHPVKG